MQGFLKTTTISDYNDSELCLAYLNEIAGEFLQLLNEIRHAKLESIASTLNAMKGVFNQFLAGCYAH